MSRGRASRAATTAAALAALAAIGGLVAVVAPASLVAPAAAGSCGGGGGGDGGGGSSGGDGGGSSSSDDGSSSSSAPACIDTTDVHGYRACTGFGAWRARRIGVAVELAAISSRVDLSGIEAGGDISHSDGTGYRYRVVGEDLGGQGVAHGVALRTLVHGRLLYAGVEASVAAVATSGAERMITDDGALLAPRVTGASTTLAVVGSRRFADQLLGPAAPRRLSLGAELGGGVRLTAVKAESVKGSCITVDHTLHGEAVLEARARADLWLSPHLALGLWGGTDLLARTPSAGLVLSSHLRAFDGTR